MNQVACADTLNVQTAGKGRTHKGWSLLIGKDLLSLICKGNLREYGGCNLNVSEHVCVLVQGRQSRLHI